MCQSAHGSLAVCQELSSKSERHLLFLEACMPNWSIKCHAIPTLKNSIMHVYECSRFVQFEICLCVKPTRRDGQVYLVHVGNA